LAVSFPVPPLTNIFSAIWERATSPPILEIISPLTHVLFAIGIYVSVLPVELTVSKLTNVFSAVRSRVGALASYATVPKLPDVPKPFALTGAELLASFRFSAPRATRINITMVARQFIVHCALSRRQVRPHDSRTSKQRASTMRAALVLIAFLSMSTPAAHAIGCVVNGPRYGLTSDIVNWSMKIGNGQSCIRGLRYNNVIIESLELVSLPRTGQVTIEGPGFTYTAKSDYEGEDSFTIALSGTINRVKGSSTIRLTVSVGNSGIGDHPPRNLRGPIAAPNPPVTTPIDIDPTRFGLPTADTAGVPARVTLTNYNGPMTITTPGAVIKNVIINGQLTVNAANVTIRNCIVQSDGWWGIEGDQAPNLMVENSKIIGGNLTNSGILGSGTFVGNDISHVSIGIQLTDGASTVDSNYIHDLFYGSADPHYDGVTLLGRQNHVVIEHNTISLPSNHGTAAVFIDNDFGPVNDVIVRNNLMFGNPSYSMYVAGPPEKGAITNVVIENNYIERGYYGYFVVENSKPTIRNNIEWDNQINPIPYPKR
jgi:hypothetical protein